MKLDRLLVGVKSTLDRCTLKPSCSSPNYEVTATDCEQFGEFTPSPNESCYTCSVREDLRATAECAEGWGVESTLDPDDYGGDISRFYPDGVDWNNNGFYCGSGCVDACGYRISNPEYDECINDCPTVTSLSDQCPEGYTFTESPSTGYRYSCIFSGVTRYDPICNQCGSEYIGGSGGNGDIFCMIRS